MSAQLAILVIPHIPVILLIPTWEYSNITYSENTDKVIDALNATSLITVQWRRLPDLYLDLGWEVCRRTGWTIISGICQRSLSTYISRVARIDTTGQFGKSNPSIFYPLSSLASPIFRAPLIDTYWRNSVGESRQCRVGLCYIAYT